MIRRRLIGQAIVALGVCTMLGGAAGDPGWRVLFDGSSTQGWRTYGEKALRPQWQVVDGTLTLTAAGGGDITFGEDVTGDFELELDWKIAPGGNSGVIYMVDPAAEPGEPWKTGLEMQILDNARHRDRFNPATRAGSIFAIAAPVADTARPAGEWNRARLRVRRGVVEHFLNGSRIATMDLASEEFAARWRASKFSSYSRYGQIGHGLILLQDHRDRVQFRNIRIRKLN